MGQPPSVGRRCRGANAAVRDGGPGRAAPGKGLRVATRGGRFLAGAPPCVPAPGHTPRVGEHDRRRVRPAGVQRAGRIAPAAWRGEPAPVLLRATQIRRDPVVKRTTAMLASALVFGCASHDVSQANLIAQKMQTVREEVALVVTDEGRRYKLQQVLDDYERQLERFTRSADSFQKRIQALNADPDAQRSQFTDLIGGYEAGRRSFRTQVTGLHLDLVALTTEE